MDKYVKGKKTFINPYNFVSLNQKEAKKTNVEEVEKKDLHTGYFSCELKVVTPLAIPDVENVDTKKINGEEHNTYSFYKQDGNLMIPGSSIRGMIRSVYETATNSCMVTMDPNEQITTRSDLGSFNPCVLKKESNGWVLYKAKRIPIVGTEGYKRIEGDYERFDFKNNKDNEKYLKEGNDIIYWGDEVDIDTDGPDHWKRNHQVWESSVTYIQKKQGTGCYLYIGEKIFNKHAESVFKITAKEKFDRTIVEKSLKGLKDTLEMYRMESINRNLGKDHYGYKGFERAEKNGVIPLWYKQDNGHLYLSAAAIGRIAYATPLGNLSNEHSPCTDRKSLCPACSIFGMVGKNNNKGMGSLVSITDATIKENKGTSQYTLQELGSPRISYLPFYSMNGKDYDEIGARIRGRKFYWHNPKAKNDSLVYSTRERNNRNGTFELINSESVFSFKVYFNSLDENQVNMLAWTLCLGGNDTSLMHKLGHGKPLGLGSVKITIQEKVERDISDGYKLESSKITSLSKPVLLDENSWKQLEKILDYKSIENTDIRYPFIEEPIEGVKRTIENKKLNGYQLKQNVLANHQWFGNVNKKKNAEYAMMLPFVNDKTLTLPVGCLTEVDEKKDFEREKNAESQTKRVTKLKKEEGEIKFYNLKKGFGFIDFNGNDLYLHSSQIDEAEEKLLRPGTVVQFIVTEFKGKRQASKCSIKGKK